MRNACGTSKGRTASDEVQDQALLSAKTGLTPLARLLHLVEPVFERHGKHGWSPKPMNFAEAVSCSHAVRLVEPLEVFLLEDGVEIF